MQSKQNESVVAVDIGYESEEARNDSLTRGNKAQDGDPSKSANNRDEGPACIACRRKKAKCSREQPCSHCVKHCRECIYDEARNKPGMRAGAVEQLTQRLDKLENMFLGQSLVWQQVWKHLESVSGGKRSSNCVASDSEIGHPSPRSDGVTNTSLHDSVSVLERSLESIGGGSTTAAQLDARPVFNPQRPPKRQRSEDTQNIHPEPQISSHPLPDDLMNTLVDVYFERIHPWIPMLHVHRFRRDLQDPSRRPKLNTILHAIASITLRFSDDPRVADPEKRKAASKRSREIVILQSMEVFSVTNLQALIICAFDTIASGRGPSAWSIVGSMTRTVEQLQLGVEEEDQRYPDITSNGMISRMSFLPPSQDWCEEEERRRVFWNVMLMDRFCSISTGWNLSLTNADARRRLPCEGGLWESGERLPYPTPHFGMSDQSVTATNLSPIDQITGPKGQDFLGGFAYTIEATENLSLVTSFCLQHAADVSYPQQAQLWLMKFKQLDLRLIQWKLFLPKEWQEACAVNSDGNMDPNLTLAHITHNTAVVLLHQAIAYPPPVWQSTNIKLPSASSAETCMAAATEVSTIADHYLRNSSFLANHQFAFCLFVCARMLLANSSYFQTALDSISFDSLVGSLREIASRWDRRPAGTSSSEPSTNNLASKFASRLRESRELGSTTYDIRQAAYSDQTIGPTPKQYGKQPVQLDLDQTVFSQDTQVVQTGWSPAQVSASGRTEASTSENLALAFPPLPQALQNYGQSRPTLSGAIDGCATPIFARTSAAAEAMGDDQQLIDQDFADVYNYLNGTFLLEQRISQYSQ